jgi:hypothetical protein
MSIKHLVKTFAKRALDATGYDRQHWARTVMYRECLRLIEELRPEQLDVLEISAGETFKGIPFRSYVEANFPQFDICTTLQPATYDLIIADQIFEHLLWPYRAGRNVFAMLRPGGHFLMATPFLIRIHPSPHDCTRWTETGMRHFLAECGFALEDTRTGSWGNRACVRGNLNRWARRGWFGSLRNEPLFPVVVWGLAKRPAL